MYSKTSRIAPMTSSISRLVLLVVITSAFTSGAQAQWKWRDESGTIHYSDLPPSSRVPESRILWTNDGRRPATAPNRASPPGSASGAQTASKPPRQGEANPASSPAARQASGAASPDAAQSTRSSSSADWKTLAEQMDKRDAKRRADEQEQAKRDAQAQELKQACESLRGELRTLESGMRAATVRPDGERIVLDDAQRQARIDELQRNLSQYCSTQ